MLMHYRHYFDAAGHGTFFFGRLREDQSSMDAFTWIYDCGSLRKSHLKGLVRRFAEHTGETETIDMVCLSHFDSDHVSGLDFILEKYCIETLIIPYVPLDVRLRLASEISEELAGAGNLAAYTLDPIFYMEQRDFGARVNRIAIMRGRSPDEDGENRRGVPLGPLPERERPLGERPQLWRPTSHRLDEDGGYLGSTGSLSGRVDIYSDDRSWRVDYLYEFVFYSKSWPGARSPKSNVPIAQVAHEAREIITSYKLVGSGTPEPGWLDALKALYDTHFGHGYKQRNEISLCVFGSAYRDRDVMQCGLFTQDEPAEVPLPLKVHSRNGVLLTGDAYLNPTELKNLLAHLGDRHEDLAVMQIPHHGSDHNWSPGNAVQCNAEFYVICAPGTSKHPGATVRRDLPGYVLADYDTSVSFDYHDRHDT